jgi:hypothetical protein
MLNSSERSNSASGARWAALFRERAENTKSFLTMGLLLARLPDTQPGRRGIMHLLADESDPALVAGHG